jgi:hypothetical protein
VELGWVRDAPLVELAAQDATQGVVFYTLAQKETETPRLKQEAFCLGCHMAGDTSGVPGLLMFSSTPDGDGSLGITRSAFTDDTVPVSKRFGGWFVTGAAPPPAHQGNLVPGFEGHAILPLQSTAKLHDPDGYLATTSDIASLMVFSHQVHMVNLLVHAGFESRAFDPAIHADLRGSEALVEPVLRALADDVVDGLLFIDEARLDHKVVGSSGFAERFAAEGPRDRMGRSLRQLDLTHRLMRFPCSYLIYSSVFDSLPPTMKNMIYERTWQVLSGAENGARYRAALTFTDRQAIAAILRDTKKDLPSYFKLVS